MFVSKWKCVNASLDGGWCLGHTDAVNVITYHFGVQRVYYFSAMLSTQTRAFITWNFVRGIYIVLTCLEATGTKLSFSYKLFENLVVDLVEWVAWLWHFSILSFLFSKKLSLSFVLQLNSNPYTSYIYVNMYSFGGYYYASFLRENFLGLCIWREYNKWQWEIW